MKSKYLNILVFFALLIPGLCNSLTQPDSKIQGTTTAININESIYSMDKNLLNAGFKIENINNRAVLMFQNKPMSAAEFYMPGVEGDKALKLYIELSDTIKNAAIYLNDTALQQKTNQFGSAYIDLYREKGRYYLKLVNLVTQSTNNYYFDLDKPLKLSCHGIKDFGCTKIYYQS